MKADGMPAPPPGYRIVEIDTPPCAALRDVVSRRWDFESTRIFCDSFLTSTATHENGTRPPAEGMWVAAVVTYGRAFNQGVRNVERVDTSVLNEAELELHEYVIALRNRHFAHPVNRYEDVISLAYLTDSAFLPRAVTRVGQTHVSLFSASPELAQRLRDLASKFVRACDLRVRALHVAIGKELAGLGMDSVYASRDIAIRAPSRKDVDRRR